MAFQPNLEAPDTCTETSIGPIPADWNGVTNIVPHVHLDGSIVRVVQDGISSAG
jgi:hypothetical protein